MKHLHIVGIFSVAIMVFFILIARFPDGVFAMVGSLLIHVFIVGMVVAVLNTGPEPKPYDMAEDERPFYEFM
jgi:hypothetical protein